MKTLILSYEEHLGLKSMLYSRDGQTFLLTGQISLRYCIVGSKKFFGLFFFKYDIIDVNFVYFSYKNS